MYRLVLENTETGEESVILDKAVNVNVSLTRDTRPHYAPGAMCPTELHSSGKVTVLVEATVPAMILPKREET